MARSPDGQRSHPVPGFLRDDHGTCSEIALDTRPNAAQATDHVGSPTVLKPEKQDLACSAPERCGDLPEVEIRRQHDPVFRERLLEDLAVRHPVQPLIAEMNCIVALAPQPIRTTDVDAHVH